MARSALVKMLCAGTILLAASVSLVWMGVGWAAENVAIGKITYLKGSAQVKKATSSSWTALKEGTSVSSGDSVRTEKKTKIEIVLNDKSVLRLGSNSTLNLDKGVFGASGKVEEFSSSLGSGQAYARVSKLSEGSAKFEVKTSNAIAGVRGTVFRIDSKKDRSTVVRVYTGAVAVSNAPIFTKSGKAADEPAAPSSNAAKPSEPTEKEGSFQMPKSGQPGSQPRVEVSGPDEVTRKQWEEFVAQAMQEIRVAGDGKMSAPVAFDANKDAADEWVAWNKSRDAQSTE